MSLPTKAPRCFNSQEQWNLYKKPAEFSIRGDKLSPHFNYCHDCTPEYRDTMHAAGRCAWPGTYFVKVNQIIVGRRQHG